MNFKNEENFHHPDLWSLRTSEGTSITTTPPRNNHHKHTRILQDPLQKRTSTTPKKLPAQADSPAG
jgi:hypothetical protein